MKKSIPKLMVLVIAIGGSILTMSMNDKSSISWTNSQNATSFMETAPPDEKTTEPAKKYIATTVDCLTTNSKGENYAYSHKTVCDPTGSNPTCTATTCASKP